MFWSSNAFIMIMISNFLCNFMNIGVYFLTKLLTLGILFSTAVGGVAVAKSVVLSILFLTSFILVLRASVVAKLVILGTSPLAAFILALRVVLVAKFVI